MALGSQLDAGNIPVPVIDGPGQLHALFSALTEKRQRNHADLYMVALAHPQKMNLLAGEARDDGGTRAAATEAVRPPPPQQQQSSSDALVGGWVGSRRNFACKAVGQINRTQSLAFKVKIAMLDPSGGMERADQGKPALLAVASPSPLATATS